MLPSIPSTVPLNIGFSLIHAFLCLPCSRPSVGPPHFCSSCSLEFLLPWIIYSHLSRLTSRVILSKPAFSALGGAKASLQGAGLVVRVVRQGSLWDSLKGSGFVFLVFLSPGLQQHLAYHLAPRKRHTEPPLHPPGGRAGQASMVTPRQSLLIGYLV